MRNAEDGGFQQLWRGDGDDCYGGGGQPVKRDDAYDAPSHERGCGKASTARNHHDDEAADDEKQKDAQPAESHGVKILISQDSAERMAYDDQKGRDAAQILD